MVRNSSRERGTSYAPARFFPSYAALVEEHLPSVATMRATFVDAGFALTAHEIVVTPNCGELV